MKISIDKVSACGAIVELTLQYLKHSSDEYGQTLAVGLDANWKMLAENIIDITNQDTSTLLDKGV